MGKRKSTPKNTAAGSQSKSKKRRPAIPERTRNHKTAKVNAPALPDPAAASWLRWSHRCSLQDPWEQSVVDGPEYEVDTITGHEFHKGTKLYHVTWKEGDCTKEPQENLVGATQLVKDYNEARDEADRQDKARLVESRKLRKAEQLAAAIKAKAAACAKALAAAMMEAPLKHTG